MSNMVMLSTFFTYIFFAQDRMKLMFLPSTIYIKLYIHTIFDSSLQMTFQQCVVDVTQQCYFYYDVVGKLILFSCLGELTPSHSRQNRNFYYSITAVKENYMPSLNSVFINVLTVCSHPYFISL